jgi:ABC-type multidrug transport system fused ATPase/permease subunit
MKGRNAYNAMRSMGMTMLKDVGMNGGAEAEREKPSLESPLIEFKNARFAYPARPTQPILRGLNLKAKFHDSILFIYTHTML